MKVYVSYKTETCKLNMLNCQLYMNVLQHPFSYVHCFQLYMCYSIQPGMAVIVYIMCSFSTKYKAAAGNRPGPGSSGDNAEEMDTSLGTG